MASALRFDDKRILVIEDHAEMRSSMKSMLDRLGGRNVDISINGEEAIECLKKKEYDLVLSDYELGRGKDGQQILEETRHAKLLRAGAAYVMVTAAQTIEMVMGALEYHPDGYVTKPITFDTLNTRLHRIFKHKSYFQHINNAIDNNDIHTALRECERLINT
ncbi:MAG: response regulator, partial [Gammaproteobacteria bacterium]